MKNIPQKFWGKVVFVYTTNAYGGMEIYFSTWTLDGGESSASCPGCFTLEKRVLVFIDLEGGWAPEWG